MLPLIAAAFLGGVLLCNSLSALPDRMWMLAALPAAYCCWPRPGLVCSRWLRVAAFAVLGFLWAAESGHQALQAPLPEQWQGTDLVVEGWVAGLPEPGYRSTRFLFEVATLRLPADSTSPPNVARELDFSSMIRLTWYAEAVPQLVVGDRWSFTVRLKRPRGFANPGAADYERWLFANGIRATGYVRATAGPEPALLQPAERFVTGRWRQSIAARFGELLADSPFLGMLSGLAVGDKQRISQDQWQVLRETGTGHLMAISGLHIGLVSALAFALTRAVWSFSLLLSLPLVMPASHAGALGALAGSFCYALLAGFSLPTQRALIMLSVVLIALLWRRPVAPARVLSVALLATLVFDPRATLTGGFWLSFGAVSGLVYLLAGRRQQHGPLRHWIQLQLGLLVVLAPAGLQLFQSLSLLAPVANLIAIPWASIAIVPLTLLAVVALPLGDLVSRSLLEAAALTTAWLWEFLTWLAHIAPPWAVWMLPAPPLWALPIALGGAALLLAPRGFPARGLGAILLLPVLVGDVERPAIGLAEVTLLDVGQGTAAVIETASRIVVFGTGPRLGRQFDAARAALIPYLRQRRFAAIDLLIIGRADSAHSGGVRALREAYAIGRVLAPAPLPLQGAEASQCEDGAVWWWDRVRFQLLPSGKKSGCILAVSAGADRFLFADAIGAADENALASKYLNMVKGAVVATDARHPLGVGLLSAIRPPLVLLSTGYRNRYGYPRAEFVDRIAASGAAINNTANDGAIALTLGERGGPAPRPYRPLARRYWHSD